jgi:hypothetical protein
VNGVKTLLKYAQLGWHYRFWYDDAREYIVMECVREGWDIDRFIDVMSVLSPRVSVRQNWLMAVEYMRTSRPPARTLPNVRVSLAHYEEAGVIRGPKTSAFSRALQGAPDALVLDTWMAKALDVPHAQVTNVKQTRMARRRVGVVAKLLDISIRDTQAAIWAGVCMANLVRPGNLQDAVQGTNQMSLEF